MVLRSGGGRPRLDVDPGHAGSVLQTTASAKDLRFLVVEDQQVQRAIIVELLKNFWTDERLPKRDWREPRWD